MTACGTGVANEGATFAHAKEKSANEGNLFFHTLVVFVNDFSLLKIDYFEL